MDVYTLDDLEVAVASIRALPVDLTNERGRPNGPRFWDGFMDSFLLARRQQEPQEPEDQWMGFTIHYTYADVRHPIYLFGHLGSKSVGRLMMMTLTRNPGEKMILASAPLHTGGITAFHCAASSDDYAAVLRMLARTMAP